MRRHRLRLLGRALRRRCPRCGSGGLFRRWVSMVDRCPGCGWAYEREQGYWLGAIVLNMIVTIGVFVAALVGVSLLTWPDVPFVALAIGTTASNVLVPIVGYPWSKTLWVALDLAIHPEEFPELGR